MLMMRIIFALELFIFVFVLSLQTCNSFTFIHQSSFSVHGFPKVYGPCSHASSRLQALVPRDDPSFFSPSNLYSSFNSTTVKTLLEFKDNFMGWVAGVENSLISLSIALQTKVARDIRLTLGAGDFVTRRAANDMAAVSESLQKITSGTSTVFLLPTRKEDIKRARMLSSLTQKSTKERAKALRKISLNKIVTNNAAAKSMREIRELPSKLKYDYELRSRRGSSGSDPSLASNSLRALPRIMKNVATAKLLSLPSAISVDAIGIDAAETNIKQPESFTHGDDNNLVTSFSIFDSQNVVSETQLLGWTSFCRLLQSEAFAFSLFTRCSTLPAESLLQLDDCLETLKSSGKLVLTLQLVRDLVDLFSATRNNAAAVSDTAIASTTTEETEKNVFVFINQEKQLQDILRVIASSFNMIGAVTELCYDSLSDTLSTGTGSIITVVDQNVYFDQVAAGLQSMPVLRDSDGAPVEDSLKSAAVELETTAETVALAGDSLTRQRLITLLQALDIVFFLIEAVIKALVPFIQDGGSLLLRRVQATYLPTINLQIYRLLTVLNLTPTNTAATKPNKQEWQLYDQLSDR